ncbi:MAG: hypothetical protein L6Q29_02545 [Candidatus Pacebacteria bacterium]|nr:hypothetical protein [Candidatus Paceibacterota bacterium]
MEESFESFGKNRQNSYEAPMPRVVGDASDDLKQKTKEHFQDLFYKKHLADLPKEKLETLRSLEYEKSPIEKELIEAADSELNDIMHKAGVKPFGVSAKNIHLVPPELFREIDKTGGDAITFDQHRAIFIDAEKHRNNSLDFGKVIFHELFHLKGHLAVEVEEDGDGGDATVYRSGLTAYSSQKKDNEHKTHKHFSGLEEGLAGELERRYFKKLIEHPALKKQKEWLESKAAKEVKEKISKSRNIPVEEINNVKENGYFETFSYPFHRQVLNLITSEIYNKNKDKFKSEEEVLNIFIKAHFDGKILPMSRLIADTFNKDVLRMISMMDGKKDSGVQTLEFLEKKIARRD